ncbi:putative isoflavone reductase family protein [Cadophora sp. DSE1049]|nr:putative isoflavone reductase family protein [Cadophora sp. DSE1049]
MAQQNASTQPSGFNNHIKNVALVGAGGTLGSHILTSLLATGKHHITILTRPESTSTFPSHPSLTTKHIDYTSPSSLTTALTGQDILIITMSVTAPPTQEESLIRAAATAGVKYIMPNEWGHDFSHEGLAADTPLLGPKLAKNRKLIEHLGVSKWVTVTGGFWYEYSLAGTEWRYGFDFGKRSVTFFGDGEVKVNTSTWEQFARTVSALLSLPILPKDSGDKQTTLSSYDNKHCYISSFRVSQKDMFDSVLRVTGTKKEDWMITYEDAEARWKRGMEMFKQGNMVGFGIAMYARDFFGDGAGDFERRWGLSNEILGLPKEDFDACTRKAVEMAEREVGAEFKDREH